MLLALLAARFLASRALIPIGRALEQQEQFVADASHELRAPLTLLQADVEVLNRALRPLSASSAVARPLTEPRGAEASRDTEPFLMLPHEDREILDEMTDEIGHMNRLIADLLTLARYDAGVPAPYVEGISLTPLLTALTERLRGQVTQAQVTLHLLLPKESSPLIVRGDPHALHRLLVILLTNAITYTPAGGSIWIQADICSEKHIQVSVRDTGVGIAAPDLPHLFTRFYRADQARTRSSATPASPASVGVGLGLAIAQHIVEQLGGTITASSPGKGLGTTLTVSLKRMQSAVSSHAN
jgi:signal transduction histidine kinase